MHLKIRHRGGIDPQECILAQRQLMWAGHVRRMPESRLPHQVIYDEIAEDASLRGGHARGLKTTLKKCDISHSD